jgi:RimJ/RimL family protein N-acetyltransferase
MTGDEGPTFPTAPPERIELTGGRALVRWSADRATAAVTSINESLEHLRPWMAWAAEPASEAAMATFLAAGEQLWDQRRDFGYSIVEGPEERVVGGCGLHGRQGPDGLDIGYWIHVDRAGRGLATEASRALTDAAFAIEGIERVRIQCDERNVRSARVPEKLGFRSIGLSDAGDRHPGRESTMDWVVERADWIAMRQETAS